MGEGAKDVTCTMFPILLCLRAREVLVGFVMRLSNEGVLM